jgi:hypothetical protein
LNSHQVSTFSPVVIPFLGNQMRGRYLRVQLTGAGSLSLAEVQIFGVGGLEISNLVRDAFVYQSSTLPGYSTAGPQSAIDGNTDGDFFHGSVTHTNLEFRPWWQVALGTSFAIDRISIWNRTDCCASRLNDYWVFVSNNPILGYETIADLQARADVLTIHQSGSPDPSITLPIGMQGQFIRIQLGGTNSLSLAEVQVFGTSVLPPLSNLAAGKPAAQSSTLSGYPASGPQVAVDGNNNGDFFKGSVTHTNADANAWWQVDLGASAAINSVVVWNRTDCCGTRLNDYWVFVSNAPFLASDTPANLQTRANTFASHQTAAPNPSTSINVGGTSGRYVRIQLSGANNLSLAEVQVFGQ